jgi:hypothetical protein
MRILVFILMLIPGLGFTDTGRTSDAFLVTVFETYVSVVSPAAKKDKLSVIIENKTLTSIHGKFTDKEGKTLEHITIGPKSFEVRDLNTSQSDLTYFVPLSPPGQEVELVLGKKSYEIPQKK